MNLVDSSGWLEYFAEGPNTKQFVAPLRDSTRLVVPAVCIYEVFKVVLREANENAALQAAAAMQKGIVVDLTAQRAMAASKISLQHHLPMADSVIFAIAREHNATLWTQDAHFQNIPGVKFFPKRKESRQLNG